MKVKVIKSLRVSHRNQMPEDIVHEEETTVLVILEGLLNLLNIEPQYLITLEKIQD